MARERVLTKGHDRMNGAPIAPRAVPTAAVGMPSSFEPRHDLQGSGIRLKRGPLAALCGLSEGCLGD
jgi:hypothetical protein